MLEWRLKSKSWYQFFNPCVECGIAECGIQSKVLWNQELITRVAFPFFLRSHCIFFILYTSFFTYLRKLYVDHIQNVFVLKYKNYEIQHTISNPIANVYSIVIHCMHKFYNIKYFAHHPSFVIRL
jgi:hypothetical protein